MAVSVKAKRLWLCLCTTRYITLFAEDLPQSLQNLSGVVVAVLGIRISGYHAVLLVKSSQYSVGMRMHPVAGY